MPALLLTCAIFLFWLAVGRAAFCAIGLQQDRLRALLLSPSLGMAILMLAAFLLNRLGLPVRTFGPALSVVLVLGSAGLIAWRGRPFVTRSYLPFVLVLIVAALAVGWPLLSLGFGWLSYGSDDTGNYILLAQRLYEGGFFAPPNIAAAASGQDYAAYYWPIHVLEGARAGSETLLAWAMSVTRLDGYGVFMPVTIAMQMSLTSAVGALVLQEPRRYALALAASAMVAVSALTALGTLDQLIAQVGGLALMSALVTVTFVELPPGSLREHVRSGAPAALLGAALLVQYPEITPFFGLAFILYVGLAILRRRSDVWRTLAVLLPAAGVGAVILNTYLPGAVTFLLNQTTSGLSASPPATSPFPELMVPSGLAALWGFQAFQNLTGDPWLSTSIALGGVLLVCAAVLSVYLVWRREPAAYLTLVILAVGVRLFLGGVDFGLFKLAMYAQPFLLASLVTGVWLLLRRPSVLRFAVLGAIAVAGLPGLTSYAVRAASPFTAVTYGSQLNVEQQLAGVMRTVDPSALVSDTDNDIVIKMAAYLGQGVQLLMPTRSDLFSHFVNGCGPGNVPVAASSQDLAIFQELRSGICSTLQPETFNLQPTQPRSPAQDAFDAVTPVAPALDDPSCEALLTDGTGTIFNRWQSPAGGPGAYQVQPCRDVADHLVFINSSLGQDYYFGEEPQVGLYQLEGDPFFPGASMAGIGQYLLFQVLGPTSSMRVMVDMTSSLLGDGQDQLPPSAAIVGADRTPLPFTGSGAGRVISAPVTPQMIDGVAYVAIDMGESGEHLPEPRPGLMGLYGQAYHQDERQIVGFARDISLISDADYQSLQPPTTLNSFPGDLSNPQLEYSGIYENGWVSSAAFVRLTRPDGNQALTIQGTVPQLQDPSFQTTLQVLADGTPIGQTQLQPGPFSASFPVPAGDSKPRIDLRFSAEQTLPAPDGRPVTVQLKSLGFQPAQLPAAISNFPGDVENPLVDASGISPDGSVSGDASVRLARPGGDQVLTIDGTLPPLDGAAASATLQVLADGTPIGQAELQPGSFSAGFAMPAGGATSQINLRVNAPPGGNPPPVQLTFLGFQSLQPLTEISAFPSDLGNPEVEASGISADGWASQDASVRLARPSGDQTLAVAGMLPVLDDPSFRTTVQVLADGTAIGQASLKPGPFSLSFAVPAGDPKPQIELRFSAAQTIPDGRQVTVLLQYLGFL